MAVGVNQVEETLSPFGVAGRGSWFAPRRERTFVKTVSCLRMRPVLMRTPFAIWDALAGLAESLPHPPLTRNKVELLQIDTTASDNLPGFRVLGISPRSLEEELEAMLKQSK
jgi:hypothetical protein